MRYSDVIAAYRPLAAISFGNSFLSFRDRPYRRFIPRVLRGRGS
jgi:hypothetical protein